MATRTTSKDKAKGNGRVSATRQRAASGSLASAAETAGHKRTVKQAQQHQRTDTSQTGLMAAHDAEQRHRMVAEAAYHRAQLRNFAPGHEFEDWLDAEAEIEHRGSASAD
jgi:uncharacterized protein involved in type VI secretion and phage assembly